MPKLNTESITENLATEGISSCISYECHSSQFAEMLESLDWDALSDSEEVERDGLKCRQENINKSKSAPVAPIVAVFQRLATEKAVQRGKIEECHVHDDTNRWYFKFVRHNQIKHVQLRQYESKQT
mmetsp:Transcript_7364/g.10018  ORF Transcript_7364/g.10018 Transcript_7364/m.10018 type:complete len:126 (-) Transcript_7364:344-721(-)